MPSPEHLVTRAPPVSSRSTRGVVVLIGGAEDRTGDREILRALVDLGGGREARVAVVTVATRHPRTACREYRRVFERLGVAGVRCVDPATSDDPEAAQATIDWASVVFFTGGDQRRIADRFVGSRLGERLVARHRQGLVVAGTSAGAAVMSEMMITGGHTDSTPEFGSVRLGAGLGILPGMVIDQHFAQRRRMGRLLEAVARRPHVLGVGVDENTALIVRDGWFEVVGADAVTVLDAEEAVIPRPPVEGEAPVAVSGVALHVIPPGFGFDLGQRALLSQHQVESRGEPG